MKEISEDVETLSAVIAVWGWQLLAWMFFLKSIGFLFVDRYEWFFGLMGVFVICELISLNKKWGLDKF